MVLQEVLTVVSFVSAAVTIIVAVRMLRRGARPSGWLIVAFWLLVTFALYFGVVATNYLTGGSGL